jgi:hypothetical protein
MTPTFPPERIARIRASIDLEPEALAPILEANQLDEEAFEAMELALDDEVAAQATLGACETLRRYDAAYVERIAEERGELGVEEMASLTVAVEQGREQAALAAMSMPTEASMRVLRWWAAKVDADEQLEEAFERALEKARGEQ